MTYDALAKMARDLQRQFKSYQPMFDVLHSEVVEIGKRMQAFAKQIDFDLIEQTLDDTHDVLKERTESMAQENIFLNIDMLDGMYFGEIEEKLNSKWVMEWMESYLEETIEKLVEDKDCFEETTLLLSQSYNAYERGDYAIGFMALYPVIDTFVTHWHKSDDGKVKITTKGNTRSLKPKDKETILEKHQSILDSLSQEKRYAIEILFGTYALKAYSMMFDKDGHHGFKRHHTLHGSISYANLKKEDYIKLFFFLYNLYQLQEISQKEYMAYQTKKNEQD